MWNYKVLIVFHISLQDCPTRWGSMNKIISRIIEQEEAIRRVLSSDRKTISFNLTWQDKDVLESMNKVLSQLSSLTDILSGENYVTISSVLPMIELLNNTLLKDSDGDTELTTTLKQVIKDDINSRYSSSEAYQLLKISSFLDPRFKSKYIGDSALEDVKLQVVSEAIAAVSVHQQQQPFSPASHSTSTVEGMPPQLKRRKTKTLGTFTFFKENEDIDNPSLLSSEEKLTKEIEVYMSSPQIDAEDEPLVWWKANCKMHPMLSKLARKYLAVCATSSPSEQIFSSSGHIVNSLRANLNPEKVYMLVFLNTNL